MTDLRRLRWQCRRGCKELDLLLNDYLEHYYASATIQQQQYFEKMLLLDDAELLQAWESHGARLKA